MANLLKYSETNYRTAFTKSFFSRKLAKGYFVHMYGSPYDDLSFIDNEQETELRKVNNLFNNIRNNRIIENEQVWKNKEKSQLLKLKIYGISLAKKLGKDKELKSIDIDNDIYTLTKKINELYQEYYKSKTFIYNENGYINSFFILALESILKDFKKDFPSIYKQKLKEVGSVGRIWNGNISLTDFFNKISNPNYWKGTLKGDQSLILAFNLAIKQFVTLKEEKVEANNKIQQSRIKKKSSGKQNTAEIIYKLEKNILKYMSANSQQLYSQIILNSINNIGTILSDRKKGDLGKTVGNSNEKIIEWLFKELFEEVFSSDPTLTVSFNTSHTGPNRRTYTINDNGQPYQTTGEVKTDVSIDINTDELQKFLSSKEDYFKNTIDLLSEEEDNIKINLSAKNSNDVKPRNIRAQSNENLTSYAAILATQLKDQSIYNTLGNNELLHYFLLNESVNERKDRSNFRKKLSQYLEKAGLLLLIGEGFVDENDEVDFLIFNQKIIPTSIIQQEYLKEVEENYNNKLFSMHIRGSTEKTSIKPTTKDEKYVNKVEGTTYIYHENFLNTNRDIGLEQYRKIYFYTEMNIKSFKERILNKIFDKI